MSGRIEFKVRPGDSYDPRFEYYPEWYLKIIGENEQEIDVSPTYNDVWQLLVKMLQHERINDKMRGRRPDFDIKRKSILDIIDREKLIRDAQTGLDEPEFSIPQEYIEINTPKPQRYYAALDSDLQDTVYRNSIKCHYCGLINDVEFTEREFRERKTSKTRAEMVIECQGCHKIKTYKIRLAYENRGLVVLSTSKEVEGLKGEN